MINTSSVHLHPRGACGLHFCIYMDSIVNQSGIEAERCEGMYRQIHLASVFTVHRKVHSRNTRYSVSPAKGEQDTGTTGCIWFLAVLSGTPTRCGTGSRLNRLGRGTAPGTRQVSRCATPAKPPRRATMASASVNVPISQSDLCARI
jgi:hypothetical protein